MSTADTNQKRSRWTVWIPAVVEALVLISSVIYIIKVELWSLFLWAGITTVYLLAGLAWSWKGTPESLGGREVARYAARWSWLLPLSASVAGVYSAVLALTADLTGSRTDTPVALAASIGAVLAWTLLHVGFAHAYQYVEASDSSRDIRFPGRGGAALIDFLYFSFTIGTSFATSDVEVLTLKMRRLVMVHSIFSFFYNALVVAIAFQVLQQIVRG